MVIAAKRGRVPLPGSERKPVSGAKPTGKVDPGERIQVLVYVRRRGGAAAKERKAETGVPLSRAQFRETMGADPEDLLKVERFAHEHGLEVVQSSVSQR